MSNTKVITKKSFIGGRLVYPGAIVDVDEKGAVLPAGSTPVDQLSDEQLESVLAARKGLTGSSVNTADPVKGNTGVQEAAFANIRPGGDGSRPQVIPPGTEEHQGSFVHPASEDAPAAIEQVVAPGGDVDTAIAPASRRSARKQADD